MTPRLTVITLARKPLASTVAANALKWGTGGLNIDGTRIGHTEDFTGVQGFASMKLNKIRRGEDPADWEARVKGGPEQQASLARLQTLGRWPANLIPMHEPRCRKVGQHYEEFSIMNYLDPTSGNYSFFAECEAERGAVEGRQAGQMVEDWECVEGCPCLDLDRQSGVFKTTWVDPSHVNRRQGEFLGALAHPGYQGFNDSGGASRYFKQVQSEAELHEYLTTLISPPPQTHTSPRAQVWKEWPWVGADNPGSQVGLILHGFTPTPEQVTTLYNLLTPGGHLCLFAPDDQPTGHTGACRLEDAGFEIRDALLWVRGPGRLHYIPKVNRGEREAGCSKLPAKKGHEAVERAEGSAGAQNPRAGAGRTAEKVRNHHPTVKPIELMERLLSDIPPEAVVLDPFMGSGTTGVACSKQERSFIGIEREKEYLAIADARIRYWDRAYQGWRAASIVSDLEQEPAKADFLDFFGEND